MITLLPDFDRETESIYWENIEEILRDKRIIKAYEKLHLIRLKNFIENQMISREFQVYIYLAKVSNEVVYHSFELNIKERLGEIKLNEQGAQYKNYLNTSEIKIVEKEIKFLLRATHQYCCSYHSLIEIRRLIYNELDGYYSKEKHTTPDKDDIKGPPEPKSKIKLKIDQSIFNEVYNGLSAYLNTSGERSDLLELLNGENINYKLNFTGNINQLTELFKRIEYSDGFSTTPDLKEVFEWLKGSFKTNKGDINEWVYTNHFCKTDFKIKENKIICKKIPVLNQDDLIYKKNRASKE